MTSEGLLVAPPDTLGPASVPEQPDPEDGLNPDAPSWGFLQPADSLWGG